MFYIFMWNTWKKRVLITREEIYVKLKISQ